MRRIRVRGQPRQIVVRLQSPIITREKWTGGVSQECLLCKCEALSSKPKPTKKKKKKKTPFTPEVGNLSHLFCFT
jgi:hypothetical protein